MRLLELEIENFGVFAGKQFDFGDGFQLISGPNEAGKSTLLQLIRQVFFGFPHRSPYLFAGRAGEMAATAVIQLADRRQVRYRRRKGTKGAVVGNFLEAGETGDAVDEPVLTGLLGNANADLYTNVFGFSLAELAAGEQSLRQTDLTEALYGGGLGGLANFQKLRGDIRSEHEQLFSPGASKREINRLLAGIRDKRRAVSEATVKPRDYHKARDEAQQLEAEVEEIRGRREAIQQQRAHLKRLSDSLSPWLNLQAAREELAQLQAPEAFPTGGEQRFRSACQRRVELVRDLDEARDNVADFVEKLKALQLQPGLVEREADVKRLEMEVGRMRQYAQHVPQRSHESKTIKENVLAQLKELNPAWDLSHLEQFQTSQPERDAIETVEQELDDLERQQGKLEARRPDLVEEIERRESELKQLAAIESVTALEKLVERASGYQTDREAAADLDEQIGDAEGKLAELGRQLESPLQTTLENPASLPVPLDATLGKYRDEFNDSSESLRDATRRLEEVEQEVADKQRALAELDAQARIPDRAELLAQRERRDAGWRLIRGKHIRQDPGVSEQEIADWIGQAADSLPDRYEREVERADQLADERQEKAENVARREQLAAQLESLQQRVADLTEQRTLLERERQRLETAWEGVWDPCGFKPLSPAEMLEWLRLHEDYLDEARQQTKRQAKQAEVNRRVTDFEDELLSAVGGDAPSERQLAEARRRVDAARKAEMLREKYQADMPQRRRQLEQIDRHLGELSNQREDWDRRWREKLDGLGFPTDWSVGTTIKILGGLADARKRHSEAESLDKRVRDMQAELDAYRHEVEPLCREIAPDLSELPPEEAVVQLADRVEDAKQAGQNLETYQTERNKAERGVAKQEKQLAECEREIDGLLEAAGAKDEAEFEQAAARARRHGEVVEEIKKCEGEVNRIAAEEDAEPFLQELAAAKRDEVELQRQRAEEELEAVERSYQDRLQNAALARDRLEKLDRASDAAELAQSLESDRAQLAAAVDRWAPLVLAQTLMSQAIERFEREHQPEMLLEIGRLFSRMTRGRYTGVRRKLDEQGTLLLELQDGSHKEPSELSTGTREQLYLAMRLAYVRHYCRDAEPLPLVMDDVLVNFDDDRAKSTLDVLLKIAKDMQIIFMTCHQSIADLITAAVPEMNPIRLELDATAVGSLAAADDA